MTVRKDQMTSNERMSAYFDGKEVDRLPAMPMIDSVGPRLIGHYTKELAPAILMDAVREYGPTRLGEKK